MKVKYFNLRDDCACDYDHMEGYCYGEVDYNNIDSIQILPDDQTLSGLSSINNGVVEGLKEKYIEDKIIDAGYNTLRNSRIHLHTKKILGEEELSNALINDGIKIKSYYDWDMREIREYLTINDERIFTGTMLKLADVMNQMHKTSERLVDTIADLSRFYQDMQERKFRKELELKTKDEIDKFHSLIFEKIEEIQKFINESIRNGLIIDTSVVDNILFSPINIQMLKNMVIRYYETIVQEKVRKR